MTETNQGKSAEKSIKNSVLKELYKKTSNLIPTKFLVKYTEDNKEFVGYHAQYAIDLLNEEVGLGNWHTMIDIKKEELIGKGWVVAGMVTILINYKGEEFAVNGLGGAFAKDIANAYKGFKTSAFKNACRYLGIGKELYIKGFEEDINITNKEDKTEIIIEDNELANKIDSTQSVEELDSLKDAVQAVEGKKVQEVLFTKYNNKKISLMKKK